MSIASNLAIIEEQLTAACARSGRDRSDVQLIAVSKTKPDNLVEEAIAAGHLDFGENKVQELIRRKSTFAEPVRWHLIGHLQKNKIRKALPCCTLVHTIDSMELAERVDRISGELGIRTRALVQVNISDDPAKFGFSADDLERSLENLLQLDAIEISGLMTIPAFDPEPENTRIHFRHLRELQNRLEKAGGKPLPQLSMGMSHDFPVAIEEGATLVRVGTAIFGKRD